MPKGMFGSILRRMATSPPRPYRRRCWGQRYHGVERCAAIRL